MKLVILGAGATRGGSFVSQDAQYECLPPLDGDFFVQLQRVNDKKHQGVIDRVIKGAVDIFGNNFDVSMENYFSTLEYLIENLGISPGGRYRSYELRILRKALLDALAATFEESIHLKTARTRTPRSSKPSPSRRHEPACRYHGDVVSTLGPQDTILSFNYDCVIDDALRCCGDKKWNAQSGYRFGNTRMGRPFLVEGFDHWQPETPGESSTISLLKLHGSLHFQFHGSYVKLKVSPYVRRANSLKYNIIPPVTAKRYQRGVFRNL